jgi:putative ABC transport system permease protein
MLFWTVFKVGIKSLLASKLRSILAMLGIIIGVGAVIAMLAIGSGAQKQVMDRFNAMGTNLLIVQPGQRGTGGVASGLQQNLTLEEAQAIAREVPGIALIAPVVQGNAQIKYANRNARTTVIGTATTYQRLRDIQLDRGRPFTEGEVDRMSRVAIIGPVAARNIFGASDALGETIKVNGINFQVIGVSKPKGEGWMSPDDRITVPYTVAMQLLFGVTKLRQVEIQAADGADLAAVQEGVTKLLRREHRIAKGADDDFQVTNMADIRESANEVTGIFKYLLGGIAAISLLVGGIGIMNIMLVTVTERTREIGIRKAIGARDAHILLQFLVESVIMSGLGGVIGLGVGTGAALLIAKYSPLKTVLDPASALMSMGVAAGVGIFFGFYPAWRASRLDPIQALRHE